MTKFNKLRGRKLKNTFQQYFSINIFFLISKGNSNKVWAFGFLGFIFFDDWKIQKYDRTSADLQGSLAHSVIKVEILW